MAPSWMCSVSVDAYHFICPVSTDCLGTDRKLPNKTSHVQSISTIAISCHISSDAMVITRLTQISWRTEVYNQSRQMFRGFHLWWTDKIFFKRTRIVERKDAVISLLSVYDFWWESIWEWPHRDTPVYSSLACSSACGQCQEMKFLWAERCLNGKKQGSLTCRLNALPGSKELPLPISPKLCVE